MVGVDWLGGGGNGYIYADCVVVGFQLLAAVRNGMNGDVSRACIGAGVVWDEVGWFKEDICLVAD